MLVQHESVQYGNTPYPSWSIGIGWIISLIPISVLVLGMVHTICTLKGSFKQVRDGICTSLIVKMLMHYL